VSAWTRLSDPKILPWFRYSFSDSTLTQSAGLPSLPSSLIINSRNFGGSWVHVFGPTRIVQFQGSHSEVADNGINEFKAPTADLISAVGWDPSFVSNFTSGRDFVPELGIQGINAAGEEINLTPVTLGAFSPPVDPGPSTAKRIWNP
jgi:hypothetical protein